MIITIQFENFKFYIGESYGYVTTNEDAIDYYWGILMYDLPMQVIFKTCFISLDSIMICFGKSYILCFNYNI